MMINYLFSSLGIGIFTLLVFGVLQWLHIQAGSLVDWVIGIASFWWLLVIVTVPWNVYFDSKEVLADAAISKTKGIAINQQQIDYAKKVSQWSILIAISLHFLSALGLYILAATGISAVGFVSSGATLLLTILRPALRAYGYIATRLSSIRSEIKYPREDMLELRDRTTAIEAKVQSIEAQINPEDDNSWTGKINREYAATRQEIIGLRTELEKLQAKNQAEHQKLRQEAREGISQLTEDSQFLSHVREIIRFFKAA